MNSAIKMIQKYTDKKFTKIDLSTNTGSIHITDYDVICYPFVRTR